MKIVKSILLVSLILLTSFASAETQKYWFDIKLFEIADVHDGVQNYQTLEPFSNPKMITKENEPALMKLSGKNQKELNFELELLARNDKVFDIKFELFKDQESVSGPIKTEGYSSDKTWLMVTNFDAKKILVTVTMSKFDDQQ